MVRFRVDVRASEAETVSRRAATYAASATLLSVALAAPVLVAPAYGRALSTLVILFVVGLAVRGVLGSALAFRPLAALGPNTDFSDTRASGAPSAGPTDAPDGLPTVSVVVTAYDEADTLPATIEACREFAYPTEKLEVLLCHEAASSDGTERIAERAAEDDARFRAIERDAPPGGKAAAANFGLERATGEVVAFVDAGQRPEPDAVRRAVEWFRADDDAWCVKGRCWGTNSGDSLVALHATVERHLAERGEFVAREVASGFTLFTGGFAFFRRTAFAELGSFDEHVLLEDVEFASRIHARGKRVRVDPGVVSAETNPATPSSWWSRRKRWARGGMQVARRHLGSLARNRALSPVVRADAALTFGALLALPVVLLALPAVALSAVVLPALGGGVGTGAGILDAGAATYLPDPVERAALVAAEIGGLAAPLGVFARDHLDGRPHPRREYAAIATLPLYFAVEGAVVVAAFLDEFVLRRPAVYVPSDRPGADGDGPTGADD